ncbi:MAG: peptidylprolyl isomerase [Marinirhabdus sp.]
MKKLTALFIFLSLSIASCQDKYPDLEEGVYAEFVTNKGTFVAQLYHEAAPLTVSNFVGLAQGTNKMVDSAYKGKKFYEGLTFHRVMKDFMVQGGDPLGTGLGGPGYRFPDEFNDTLQHARKGVLSMANYGPGGTNGSQFFITLKATPWLDGRHTVFGKIVKGQDVVDAIGVVPTSKPGDKPLDSIYMQQVNILEKGDVKVPYFTAQMEAIEKEKRKMAERVAKVAEKKKRKFDKLEGKTKTLPSGIKMYFHKKNGGPKPEEGSKVLMNYAGYFANGELFDTNILENAEMYEMVDDVRKAAGKYAPSPAKYSKDARLIAGFREAILNMNIGDKTTVYIPAHLGYGQGGYPPRIPPNTDLVFELELVPND